MTDTRIPGIAALALLALTSSASAQACPDPAALTRDLSGPLATIRFLADDALEGRLAGSAGERCAGDFIAARFQGLGLEPAGTDAWFHPVPLASVLNPHAPGGTGRNVAALLRGTDPRLADEIIVVGAHYDHLGHGGPGSMAPGETAIHNGADDNASGVAAMLAVAEALASGDRPARSVLFVAFTGEESGLLGSAHFVREGPIAPGRLRAMINMDMVGRLEGRPLIVYGVETAAEWKGLLERAAGDALELALRPEGYGPSDHTSFYTADVPVLHLFTNTHADYHRPSDDWDRIDHAGVQDIASLVTRLVGELARPATMLSLQKGAGEPPRPAAGGGYGAYLGTVPDFAPVERGVLLGGVTPGSPGDQAGLRKGDVLIRLGGKDVADLEGFTAALRAHRPGDEVDVVVLRDGREVRVRARLGTRGG